MAEENYEGELDILADTGGILRCLSLLLMLIQLLAVFYPNVRVLTAYTRKCILKCIEN